jgi:hypothetical protein
MPNATFFTSPGRAIGAGPRELITEACPLHLSRRVLMSPELRPWPHARYVEHVADLVANTLFVRLEPVAEGIAAPVLARSSTSNPAEA